MKVNYCKKIDGLCYTEDVYDREGIKVSKVLFNNCSKLINEANDYLKFLRKVKTCSYNTLNVKARDLCHLYDFILIADKRLLDLDIELITEFINYLSKLDIIKNNYAIENSLLTHVPIVPWAKNKKVSRMRSFGRIDNRSILRVLSTVIDYLEYYCNQNRLTLDYDIASLKKKSKRIKFLENQGLEIRAANIEPVTAEQLITEEQIRSIKEKASRKNDYERFLYLVMEKTGIRIGEALGLQLIENNTEDIKRIKGDIEYVDGQWVVKVIWRPENPNDSLVKGHSSRQIMIKETDRFEFEMLLERYLKFRARRIKNKKMKWFFICNNGRKLTHNTAYKRFKRTLEVACPEGIDNLTLHSWRHTFCTKELLEGTPLELVAKLAGHRSPKTTFDTYVHYSGEHMDEIRKRYTHYMENMRV